MRWSELSSDARARELRKQYRAAVDAMQRGEDFDGNRARADAAVSALRAELYGTPSGREEHQKLEGRLQALVELEQSKRMPAAQEDR